MIYKHFSSHFHRYSLRVVVFGVSCLIAHIANAKDTYLQLSHEDYATPAILTVPEHANQTASYPAVLMLHGTASHKDEVGDLYKRLANQLAQRGIASLRIDFAGTGDSPVDYLQYTLKSAVRDAQVGLDYLRKNKHVNPTQIGVIGFSQGGLIAQMLINQNNTVPALALWSSVVGDGTTAIQSLFDSHYVEAQEKGFVTLTFPWRSPLKLSLDWFEQLKAQRSLSKLKQYRGQVLAIAGSADKQVPSTTTNVLREMPFGSFDKITIKNASHIFNVLETDQSKAEQAIEYTTDWFYRVLLGDH